MRSAGYQTSGLKEVRTGARNRSGRLVDLTLVSGRNRQRISAANFRKALGYGVIRSTNFEAKTVGSEVVFTGVGFGHGVGLCQWGAKQRAADGFDYREILSYYYPGTTLEKLNKEP